VAFKFLRSLFTKQTYRKEYSPEDFAHLREESSDDGEPNEYEAESIEEISESEIPRSSASPQDSSSKRERLLSLERERVSKGFKPGWLYFKAKDLGLLTEHSALIKEGLLQAREKFSKRGPSRHIISIPSPWENPRLLIELVPSTCWFSNLRSVLNEDEWKSLKSRTFKSANYSCQICDGRGDEWPVECHEEWSYDETTGTQSLVRLLALCPDCHQSKHPGMASIEGKEEEALAHLALINGWSRLAAENYTELAFKEWKRRSLRKWTVDVSFLRSCGFSEERVTALSELARNERGRLIRTLRVVPEDSSN
jgi:hypothetical protein